MERAALGSFTNAAFSMKTNTEGFFSLQNPSAQGRISPSGHSVSPSHHLGAESQLLKGSSPSSRPFRGPLD